MIIMWSSLSFPLYTSQPSSPCNRLRHEGAIVMSGGHKLKKPQVGQSLQEYSDASGLVVDWRDQKTLEIIRWYYGYVIDKIEKIEELEGVENSAVLQSSQFVFRKIPLSPRKNKSGPFFSDPEKL